MNTTTLPQKLLRARDVAAQLDISLALAYRLIQQGTIPSIRFSRTVRVRAEDLQAFLEHCHNGIEVKE
jgi:excisionase family DNA binding protein